VAKAIGIDLGTTNSVMACKSKDLLILRNRENEEFTRSIVGFYKGETLVGTPAFNIMPLAPHDTIISVKRLIGRAYNDPVVQEARGKKNFILYEIVPPSDGTEDSVRVIMGGRENSPVQISAKILKKLKQDAELYLGDTVDQAVITVPAYFSEKQRFATREAGRQAGLIVQKILAEPTAAAIAYGVNNLSPGEAKTILVYDFGGGTLDISILQVAGSVFAELDVEGDMWLGGDDFDELIVNYVLEKIEEEYGIILETLPMPLHLKERFKKVLRLEAEKAKVQLSSAQQAHIIIPGLLQDEDKNLIDVEVSISRARFEGMAEGLVSRSLDLVKKALENAAVTSEQIDHVLLVGGSTTIPLVQQALTALFGEDKLMRNIDPMKCVAQGAGMMAAVLGPTKECGKCGHSNDREAFTCAKCGWDFLVLGNITAKPYGIQVAGDIFEEIIPKSSQYPSPEPVKRTFVTQKDNQQRIKVPVYRGDNPRASQNERQFIGWMLLDKGFRARTQVEVSLALNGDGILDSIVVRLMDGSGKQIEYSQARGEGGRAKLEDDIETAAKRWEEKLPKADVPTVREVEKLYDEMVAAATANNLELALGKLKEFEDRVAQIGVAEMEWSRRLQGIIDYSEEMLNRYKDLISPEDALELGKMIEEANGALKANNQVLGETMFQELDRKTDEIVPANLLMLMRLRGFRAKEQGLVGEGDALGGIVSKMEAAANTGDVETFNRHYEEARPIFQKIQEKGEVVTKSGDDLLTTGGRGKTHTG
jgi:molecular chaperone DnaK (HSP70)